MNTRTTNSNSRKALPEFGTNHAKTDRGVSIYEFGDFRLDVHERLLLRNGEAISITPKTFQILALLVTQPRLLVRKEDILDRVWPNQFIEESSLTQNIYLLRKVLGEDKEVRYIETVPRAGYRFIAKVEAVIEAPALPASPVQPNKVDEPGTHQATRPRVTTLRLALTHIVSPYTLIAVGFILLSGVLLLLRSEWTSQRSFQPRSMAVLPFKSVTSLEEEDALGIGMADATILRLSKSTDFSVLPTTSVLRYRGDSGDPLKAGRELGVDSVLSGTIQKSAGRLRISVQILSTADGTVRWSATFDEGLTDIFTMQDSLSSQVATALALRDDDSGSNVGRTHQTANVEAYQSYLIGLNLWSKRTPQSLYKAIEYFRKATDQDPNYALVYATMADAYSLIARDRFGPMPASEAWEHARTFASKAMELDDKIGEAYTAMAMYKLAVEKDGAAADQLYKRALLLQPTSAVTHLRYGWFLIQGGNLEFGISELRRAQELDPISVTTNAALASALLLARQFDETIVYSRRALDIDPENPYGFLALCEAYGQLGRHDEALATLEKVKLYNRESTTVLEETAYLHALAGRKSDAQKTLSQLEQLAPCSPVDRYNIAAGYAVLGEPEQAFKWLNAAIRPNLATLKFHAAFDSIRSDPRFVELIEHGPKMAPLLFSKNKGACPELKKDL